jgi:ketosteroid isomerase-like protein
VTEDEDLGLAVLLVTRRRQSEEAAEHHVEEREQHQRILRNRSLETNRCIGTPQARDDGALAEVLADDVVWHVPGRNAVAGEYRGIDRVMEYIIRRRELVDGSFEITVHDVLANDEHGFVVATGRATRGGTTFEWRAHGLYRFRDGLIAECWVLPENQYEFDRIWS